MGLGVWQIQTQTVQSVCLQESQSSKVLWLMGSSPFDSSRINACFRVQELLFIRLFFNQPSH